MLRNIFFIFALMSPIASSLSYADDLTVRGFVDDYVTHNYPRYSQAICLECNGRPTGWTTDKVIYGGGLSKTWEKRDSRNVVRNRILAILANDAIHIDLYKYDNDGQLMSIDRGLFKISLKKISGKLDKMDIVRK